MSNSSTTKQAPERTQRSTKSRGSKAGQGFTDDERAAMRERAKEIKAAGRRGRASKADGEHDVLEKISEMRPQDRAMAERVHAVVRATAPVLEPRTW